MRKVFSSSPTHTSEKREENSGEKSNRERRKSESPETPNRRMAESSSSGLTFKLHPLVMVNISDHYSRVKSQMNPPIAGHCATTNGSEAAAVETVSSSSSVVQSPRAFGCVIGVQRGRTVEIFNSFELLYDPETHSLEPGFLEKKQELYKKVFPNFYILRWYSTGSDAQESDMTIHKALMDINESPVYVLLNPVVNPAQKDLPITIYESVKEDLPENEEKAAENEGEEVGEEGKETTPKKGKRARRDSRSPGGKKAKKEGEVEKKEPVTPVSERPTRERKVVDRYSAPETGMSSATKPVNIEKGSGTQLKDIPNGTSILLRKVFRLIFPVLLWF